MTTKRRAQKYLALQKEYDIRDSLLAIERRVHKELKRDAEAYRKDPVATTPTNSPSC